DAISHRQLLFVALPGRRAATARGGPVPNAPRPPRALPQSNSGQRSTDRSLVEPRIPWRRAVRLARRSASPPPLCAPDDRDVETRTSRGSDRPAPRERTARHQPVGSRRRERRTVLIASASPASRSRRRQTRPSLRLKVRRGRTRRRGEVGAATTIASSVRRPRAERTEPHPPVTSDRPVPRARPRQNRRLTVGAVHARDT